MSKAAIPTPPKKFNYAWFLWIGLACLALAIWKYLDYKEQFHHHAQQLEHQLQSAQNNVLKPLIKTVDRISHLSQTITKGIETGSITPHKNPVILKQLLKEDRSIGMIELQWIRLESKTSPATSVSYENNDVQTVQRQAPAPSTKEIQTLNAYKDGIWTHTIQNSKKTVNFETLIQTSKGSQRPAAILRITIDPAYWSKLPLLITPKAKSYAYLVNQGHMIIAHPNPQLIGKTLFTNYEDMLSVEKISEPLSQLLKQSGDLHYTHRETQHTYWILARKIQHTNLFIIYKINQTRWNQFIFSLQPIRFWSILWASIAAIALIMFFTYRRIAPENHIRLLSILITVTAVGLIVLLIAFNIDSNQHLIDASSAIQGPHELDQFLKANQSALKDNSIIPTGISVKSIERHHETSSFEVDAVIWQQYPESITPPTKLPIFFTNGTKLTQDQPLYQFHDSGHIMAAWHAHFEVQHHSDLSRYPFDTTTIHIDMIPNQLNQSAQLVPDFTSYPFYLGDDLPGISKSLKRTSNRIHESYFKIIKNDARSGMGVSNYQLKQPFVLSYNIVIARNRAKALITFFLPLAVIVVVCYFVSILINRTSATSVGGKIGTASGLLFVIAVTQIRFHQTFNTNIISYYDALLMYMYLLVLATAAAAVLHSKKIRLPLIEQKVQEESQFRFIFWPINTVIMLVITMFFFV